MLSRTIHAALFAGAVAMLAATTPSVDPPSTADGPPSRGTSAAPPAAVANPSMDALKPLDLPGLHNLVAFHDDVWSGSVPEGDAGFDSLTSLGVRTILSVDGALPDLERARSRGMRYVHLPIGYNGFDQARKLELARAVRDLPRPIYIHCHHGKHRSAGASAAIAVSLGWLTPDQASARMAVSGTAKGYTGLWQCTAESAPIAAALLDAAPSDFPERTMPSSLVAAMVEIDEVHDRLKLAQRAGWHAPADHPDLAPLADAGRLADLYRLLDDDAQLKDVPESERATVREWLVREGLAAARLEAVIEAMGEPTSDRGALAQRADASLALLGASCKACHQRHRD
jgi:hypothetical protein